MFVTKTKIYMTENKWNNNYIYGFLKWVINSYNHFCQLKDDYMLFLYLFFSYYFILKIDKIHFEFISKSSKKYTMFWYFIAWGYILVFIWIITYPNS